MKIIDNKAITFWVTGLSGSGKTTFAYYLQNELKKTKAVSLIIDGDEIRDILKYKNSYSKEERLELAYQYSNLAKLINKQNINVICSTISLFHEIHEYNRNNIDRYCEIFLDKDLNEIKNKDKKNIYKKNKNVVGVDLKAEFPKKPDYTIKNEKDHIIIAANIIKRFPNL